MRYFIVSLTFIFISFKSYSQDVIVLKNHKEYKVAIIAIQDDKVLYKTFDNLDGEVSFFPKTDIAKIYYQNGKIEVFEENTASSLENTLHPDSYQQGMKDAFAYFRLCWCSKLPLTSSFTYLLSNFEHQQRRKN
jgi:hypothetical protein